jgi:hypothetical protein
LHCGHTRISSSSLLIAITPVSVAPPEKRDGA